MEVSRSPVGHLYCLLVIRPVQRVEGGVIGSDSFHFLMFLLHRKNKYPERLEVDPSKCTAIDLANIVPRQSTKAGPLETSRAAPPTTTTHHSSSSEGFVDDPDVPPLI